MLHRKPVIQQGGLPRGDTGDTTEATILVSKYADHPPLYRQAQIYARQDIELDRSTLADWVGHAAWHLRPPQERLLMRLKERPRLFADEATAPVLDPGRGCTKTGSLKNLADPVYHEMDSITFMMSLISNRAPSLSLVPITKPNLMPMASAMPRNTQLNRSGG
jgi:Transposase IS66 family